MAAAGPSIAMGQDNEGIRLFLSWSGNRSKELASIFKKYITDLFPDSDIYYSGDEIRGGEKWRTNIESGLNNRNFSIIFLTESNLQSKWIYFEAGALSKSLPTTKIQPFLYGLKVGSISEPLSSYQARELDRNSILQTLYDINSLNIHPVSQDILDRNFNRLWSEMEEDLKRVSEIDDDHEDAEINDSPILNQGEQVSEILRLLRQNLKSEPDTIVPPKTFSKDFDRLSSISMMMDKVFSRVENIYDSLYISKSNAPDNKKDFLYAISEFILANDKSEVSHVDLFHFINATATKFAVDSKLVNLIIERYMSIYTSNDKQSDLT